MKGTWTKERLIAKKVEALLDAQPAIGFWREGHALLGVAYWDLALDEITWFGAARHGKGPGYPIPLREAAKRLNRYKGVLAATGPLPMPLRKDEGGATV